MRNWLYLDKRSLGLTRILFGIILLFDIVLRAVFFKAHYSSAGVLPLTTHLNADFGVPDRWSIFFLSDAPILVALLFLLYLIGAVSLTLGYRTRLAGWLCWILAVSIYRRSPLLGDAGDLYLAALLFWGNFLPWGERFSLDGRSGDEEHEQSLAGVCYILQIGIVYWFSAVLRVGREWQVDDTALYFAMNVEPMGVGPNELLLTFGQGFLSLMTLLTLVFETLGPLLLLLPWDKTRLLSIWLVVAFHVGIFATLKVPIFAVVCMIAPMALIPSSSWKGKWGQRLILALEQRLPKIKAPGRFQLTNGWAKFYSGLPVVFLLVVIYQLNAGIQAMSPKTPLTDVARVFALEQRWGMFSPHPTLVVGWEAVEARTASGREVNLLTGGELPETPEERKTYTGLLQYRWRLYHLALNYRREIPIRRYLDYLIREWNEEHPNDLIVTAQYVYYPRATGPDYLLGEEGREVLVVVHRGPETR